MSSRPWFAFYPNDFRADTLDLDMDQIGAYVLLLMLAWRRDDCALPNDMGWLKKSLKSCVADFHGHTFNRIIPKLLERYFELGADDKWRNKRLTLERQKSDKLSAKQRQNVGKRWSKYRETNELTDTDAIPSQSQSHKEKRIGNFEKVKTQKQWPVHGTVSKRRGTIWLQSGTSDFDAYAQDYREKNRIDPPVDNLGGYWFSILGEASKSA